jgi:Copper transport outer membrane protein, MctB
VSLVAVFLALALGIVMGYGVLGQPTVSGLQDRVDQVQGRINSVRRDNDQLQGEVNRLNGYADQSSQFAVTGRLVGTPVVVVALRGVDPARARDVVTLARGAGATVGGILWLESKWTLSALADTKALAAAVNVASGSKSTVRDAGWLALAERLVAPPGPADVLPALQQAGFVAPEAVGSTAAFDLATLDVTGGRVLVVDGTAASVPENDLVAPLARALTTAATPTVFGEVYVAVDKGLARGQRLSPIRTDDALTKRVSTVDDLDFAEGRVAGVLALANLGRSVVGDYGYGDGADRALPDWWAP